MSKTLANIYETSFDSMAHLAYERRGMRLPMTTRMVTGVVGKEHKFPHYEHPSAATTKTQYAEYADIGLGGNKVFRTATLSRNHWHDWVDKQDMASSTVDDVSYTATQAVQKVGQECDNKITAALNLSTSNDIAAASSSLTKAKALKAVQILNANDVPFEQRYALVDAPEWTDLLQIEEFASQDYVGVNNLPWLTAANARVWLGVTWIMFPGLPKQSNIRSCFMYHQNAIGYAQALGLETEIQWISDRDSWIVKATSYDGSVAIDSEGIVRILCDES